MKNTEEVQTTKKSKNKMKIFLLIALALAMLVAVLFTVKWVSTTNKERKVLSYLDGKIFILDRSSSLFGEELLIFDIQDKNVFVERWQRESADAECSIDRKEGRIKVSLFGGDIAIQEKGDGYWSTAVLLVLRDDGSVVHFTYHPSDPVWEQINKDELAQMKAVFLCDEHTFSKWETIDPAGCTNKGKQERICQKCGYAETQSIESLGHKYQNKICSQCGAEKQPEKSQMEANTWYTYQDVLHFQNIELRNAFSVSQGRGMMVSYYFVCQHCHVIDENVQQSVPEFNYDINKMFTCQQCGKITTVKIELG